MKNDCKVNSVIEINTVNKERKNKERKNSAYVGCYEN